MRILHLLGAAEDHGGIVSVIRALQMATASAGVEHVVWVNAAFQNRREPALELARSRHALDESASHPQLLWRAIRSLPDVRQLLRTDRFDVIHAHSRGGFAVAALLNRFGGQRVLFTNHTYANRTGLYRRAAGWAGFTTVVLTPNMARHYGLVPDDRQVRVISACGQDSFWHSPLLPFPPAPPLRLVGVGNVVRWKRWNLVIDALLRLPAATRERIEFDLWGPVPDDADSRTFVGELRALIERSGLGDRVRLRGPTKEVDAAVAAAHVFVLPSTNEPCSVALMEALALGRPALVSASGGNVDIVTDRSTGLLFLPDDVADLAAKLEEVAAGKITFARPDAIRASVQARSATAVGAQYVALYRELAGA